MKDCLFCKIIKGELPSSTIYEDDLIKVIMNINPSTNGHLLILPKEHYVNIMDIKPEVVSGDHSLVYDQIPLDFSELDAAKFLATCSKSMESQGREAFTQDEVRDFFEYRRSQKNSGQK